MFLFVSSEVADEIDVPNLSLVDDLSLLRGGNSHAVCYGSAFKLEARRRRSKMASLLRCCWKARNGVTYQSGSGLTREFELSGRAGYRRSRERPEDFFVPSMTMRRNEIGSWRSGYQRMCGYAGTMRNRLADKLSCLPGSNDGGDV